MPRSSHRIVPTYIAIICESCVGFVVFFVFVLVVLIIVFFVVLVVAAFARVALSDPFVFAGWQWQWWWHIRRQRRSGTGFVDARFRSFQSQRFG